MVHVESGIDTEELASKIRDVIKQVSLPTQAKDPIVTKIDSSQAGKRLFTLILYAKNPDFSVDYLKEKANLLKSHLAGSGAIDTIELGGGNHYEIQVLVDQNKIESLGLSLSRLAGILQGFNANQPLGTHRLGRMEYAFRIEGEVASVEELKQLLIPLANGRTIPLEQLATFKLSYNDETHTMV